MTVVTNGLLMLLAGLALPGLSLRAEANSFTDDARAKVTNRHAPWSAIGKLFLPDGSYCTGTLIARDLVLTAAHCVIDPETKGLKSGAYLFYPGYIDHHGDLSSPVTWVWWGTTDPSCYRGDDWAILRLCDKLGDRVGWMGVRAVDLSSHLHQGRFHAAGYSSDFDEDSLSAEKGCAFTKFVANSNFFLHNCDSSQGASGGPIFDYDDETQPGTSNHIVAIDVAEYRHGGETSLVHVPYSDSTANVAVPAGAFLGTLNRILAGE